MKPRTRQPPKKRTERGVIGTGANSSTLYDDYLFPGLSVAKGVSAPTLTTFRGNILQNAYAGSGPTEQAFCAFHVGHDIKAGTTPTIHVHWAHIIAVPGVAAVKWQIEVSAAKGYSAGTFGAPVTLSTVQTVGAQYEHHITDDDDMPLPAAIVADLEPDMLILFRIFRDSSDPQDTFGNDAFLLYVDIHYEVGQRATKERNRPFTSTGF